MFIVYHPGSTVTKKWLWVTGTHNIISDCGEHGCSGEESS